ncbi:MAG: HEPN domain-containing protein [Solirubrobacterales bacterium]
MSSHEREAAQALVDAARVDEAVIRELLDNPRVGDPAIGFHAQQAVEKLLKAVLAGRGIDYPPTHDIVRLLDQLGRDRLTESLPIDEAEDLTPWATELRYGAGSASALDRPASLRVVEAFRAWAERELDHAE